MTSSPLSFGLVAPPLSSETITRFDELAGVLRAAGSTELRSRAAASYQDLARSVRDGSSDIAWLPPVAYAWLAEAVTPIGSIVREGRTSYAAAVLVREDSPYRSIADLQGVRAGWVDPWSAGGYVVPRLELAKAGHDPRTLFREEAFHGSHDNALFALQRGECDVVGTYAHPPREGESEARGPWSKLRDVHVRIIQVFGTIPSDVIAVRRNLPPEDHARAVAALRDATRSEAGRPLLRAVFGGDELTEGLEAGHDALRRDYERAIADGLFD